LNPGLVVTVIENTPLCAMIGSLKTGRKHGSKVGFYYD
jgi:hypothetical protein